MLSQLGNCYDNIIIRVGVKCVFRPITPGNAYKQQAQRAEKSRNFSRRRRQPGQACMTEPITFIKMRGLKKRKNLGILESYVARRGDFSFQTGNRYIYLLIFMAAIDLYTLLEAYVR